MFAKQWIYAGAVAALAVTLASGPLLAQGRPPADKVDLVRFKQETRMRIGSETPDFAGLDDLPAQIQKHIAAHELDEDALWSFYKDIAVVTHSTTGVVNMSAWVQQQPTARMPLLAVMTAQVTIFGGNLRDTFSSRALWLENPQTRQQIAAMRLHLGEAKQYAARDPQWYLTMAELLIATKAGREEMTALVHDGIAAEPSNFQLALIGANYFLPKWGSTAEEFEAWARNISAKFHPAERKPMYARLHWQALQAEFQGQFFKSSRVDWNHLMEGWRELIAIHPSVAHLNQALLMACLGGNRALAKEVLLHPRFAYADQYWYQLRVPDGAYKPCRQWAGA